MAFVSVALAMLLAVSHIHCALYATNSTHILRIDQESGSQEIIVPKERIGRAVGLAIDIEQGLLFWSDIDPNKQGIYKSNLNGGDITRIYSPEGWGTEINSLSVDWIHEHVYFTDAARRTVEVMEYSGRNRYILVDSGLVAPRGIYADPKNKFLFWNDQSLRRIERSHLDGSERTVLVNENLQWPNEMTVDYSQSEARLYYVDGLKKTLSSCKLDGSDIHVDAQFGQTASDPVFGLTAYSGQFYATIWHQGIVAVNASRSVSNSPISIGSDVIFGVVGDDTATQPAVPSLCGSWHRCSHLCLPSDHRLSGSSYICACPSYSGITLSLDQLNCREPEQILLFALPDAGIVAFTDYNTTNSSHNHVARSSRPVAVAYDPVDKMVYWSDVKENNIQRSKLDGTQHQVLLNSSDSIGIVDGMVFDKVHRRLYFSNMGFVMLQSVAYTWHRIEMIGVDGHGRKVIVSDAEKPRGLFLDLTEGYLYYTDWGVDAKVVRVNLDGSNPKTMQDNLQNPNGVIFDNKLLYVADSNFGDNSKNGTILACTYSSICVLRPLGIAQGLRLNLPYGITKAPNRLFISDWGTGMILDIRGNSIDIFISGYGAAAGILATEVSYSVSGGDQCSSNDCDGLCIAGPSTSSRATVCACDSYDIKIQGIHRNANQCRAASSYLMFADMNAIKMVSFNPLQEHSTYTILEGDSFVSNFVALAYNRNDDTIFFSDVNRRVIYKAKSDGSNPTLFFNPGQVVDGMTMDNRRLYWTSFDNGTISSIMLSGLNSSYQQVIGGLDQPRAIEMGPRGIWLYYTEWGNQPKVSRFNLQTQRAKSIMEFDLLWPNGLHYNQMNNKIYIADAQSRKIYSAKPDGSRLTDLEIPSLPHMYDIAVMDNYLYLTSWNASGVYVVELSNKNISIIAAGMMRPTQIVLKYDNPLIDSCPVDVSCDSGCSYIPGRDMKCTCPDGSQLGKDRHSCITMTSPTGSADRITTVPTTPETAMPPTTTPPTTSATTTPPTLSATTTPPTTTASALTTTGTEPPTTTTTTGTEPPTTTTNPQSTLTVLPIYSTSPSRQTSQASLPVTSATPAQSPAGMSTSRPSVATVTNSLSQDTSPPSVLYCPDDIQILTTLDSKPVYFRPPVFSDNVGVAKVVNNKSPGDQFGLNVTKVTYTAEDAAGNKNTCEFQVSVERRDVSCVDPPVVMDGFLNCSGSPQRCSVVCHESFVTADKTAYSCTGGRWRPSFKRGFGVLSCRKIRAPKIYTQELQVNLEGSCQQPVKRFIKDLKNEVVKILRNANEELCNMPHVKLCSVEQLRVNCGKVLRSARDASNQIVLTIILEARFNDTDDAAKRFLKIRNMLVLQLKLNLLNKHVMVEDEMLNLAGARVARITSQCAQESQVKINDECSQCQVGAYFHDNECTVCPNNTYQDMEGQDSCKQCQDGYVSGPGSFLATQCEKNTIYNAFPTGTVVGVVLGLLAVAVTIVVVVLFLRRRKHYGGHMPINFNNPSYDEQERCIMTEMRYSNLDSPQVDRKM